MAAQGEREPGELGMCSRTLDPMARDGTCNFNPRGSSTPYSEHGLCRQMEPHNGGAIAPRRGTEQAAINSTANVQQLMEIGVCQFPGSMLRPNQLETYSAARWLR